VTSRTSAITTVLLSDHAKPVAGGDALRTNPVYGRKDTAVVGDSKNDDAQKDERKLIRP